MKILGKASGFNAETGSLRVYKDTFKKNCIRRELIEIYFKKGTKFIVFMPVKFLASIAG